MGIQIYILACMHETVWRWVIQPHKKSRMQEPRHIDKNHSSIRIHSHWTFKLTNQQIRRYPAEQEYRKACRWLQAYHKHIQARKHATSRMSTQSQKHSRVYKTQTQFHLPDFSLAEEIKTTTNCNKTYDCAITKAVFPSCKEIIRACISGYRCT